VQKIVSSGAHAEAVGAFEHALTPGAQEIAVASEHGDRVGAAAEDVDLVAGVDGDGGDLGKSQPSRAAPSRGIQSVAKSPLRRIVLPSP